MNIAEVVWDFSSITGELSGLGQALVVVGVSGFLGGLLGYGLYQAVLVVKRLFDEAQARKDEREGQEEDDERRRERDANWERERDRLKG